VIAEDDDRIAYLAGEDGVSLPPHARAGLDELRALLAIPAVWEHPAPGLEGSVVAAIAEEARARARSAPGRPRPTRRSLTWRRPAFGLAAVAAAALAAVAIVLGANNGGPAPQRFAMVVSGTYIYPGAHGAATLTKTSAGWRMELNASGLPRLDGTSYYYEGWLKNAAGVLVPVGTFNEPTHVTLWSGVPVTKFRTLTVTEQRANGNPASSGLRVLTGTIVTRR
jgi:hypothetical protein